MSSSNYRRVGFASRFAVILALAVVSVSKANAAREYELVFDQNDFTVRTNSSFTINVSLRETASEGDVARLAPGGADGLESTEFTVDFGVSGLLSITENAITINPALDPVFSDFITDFSPTVGLFSLFGESDDLDEGLSGTESALGPGVYEVDIATFTFQTGDREGLVDLALVRDDASVEVAAFVDDFVGDVTLPTTRITVTAIPEPTSLAVLGLTSIGILARRKRRR